MSDLSPKKWKMEVVGFYALQTIKGVGFHTLYKLTKSGFRFYDMIFSNDFETFRQVLASVDCHIKEPENWAMFQKELWALGVKNAASMAKKGVRIIFNEQEGFPPQLKWIPNPPMWLFVEGSLENLHKPSVAVVGSRKSTDEGLWLTKYVIATLADSGVVTISGLAEGIDQKAHIESMRFNVPTVAVLGTGIDSNYPKGSEIVRAEILSKGGTIVTEYLLNQSYSAENFVRRNRIQAGLANAVIPVEWKLKSGTAHTVRFAEDFGRHLIMPYLPYSSNNHDELQYVRAYTKGRVFKVPSENETMTSFITGFTADEFHSNTHDIQQIPFELS